MTAIGRTARRGRQGGGGGIALAAVAIGGFALAWAAVLGGLAADSPIIAIAIVLAIPTALIIAIRPEMATVLVAFLMYTNAVVVAVTFHGVPAIAAAALPAVLVIPLAWTVLVHRQPIVVTPALPWVVGLLVVQMVGVVFARDTTDALSQLGAFAVEGVGLYLLMTNVIRTTTDLRRVLWALLVAGILVGGLSLFQEVTKTYRNDYGGFARTDSEFATIEQTAAASDRTPRQAGPIGEKNRYAQVMLMLVPLGLFMARAERRASLKAMALLAAALALVAVVLTFSRGAFVGFGLVAVVMIGLRYVRAPQLAVVAVVIAGLLVAFPQFGARLATLEAVASVLTGDEGLTAADNSVQSRTAENLTAIAVFADHPIVGVGPGQFPSYYREYAVEVGGVIKFEDREAHNLYLDVAAEAGVLGLICLMAMLGLTLFDLRRARTRWLSSRPELADIATGLSLAVLTYMTTGIFLHLSYARYFFLVLAIAGAGAVILRRLPDAAAQDGNSQSV